jgi:hypothetical protein
MSKKILGELALAVISFCWGRWFADQNLQPELYGMSIGCMFGILLELFYYLYENRKFLSLYAECLLTNKELRLSIAYLFNIEVNGKYLLIKSNRLKDTYQPIGGVYKYFNPEAKKQLDKIGIITDNAIENDEISEYDLRVKLRNRRNLKAFLVWFFSKENREVDPWREFFEELVKTGILPAEKFGYMHYELVAQGFEKIHYDPFFKVDTFKYTDIYKPKYVMHEQENAIRSLLTIPNEEYIWVTEEEIMRDRSNNNQRIAPHTKKIFQTKKLI